MPMTPMPVLPQAVVLAVLAVVKSKTQKHLDVYHHITRENQMEFKTINVYRLPTDQMRADLMTKNLPKPIFWRHVINSYNYEPKDYVVNGIHFTA